MTHLFFEDVNFKDILISLNCFKTSTSIIKSPFQIREAQMFPALRPVGLKTIALKALGSKSSEMFWTKLFSDF